MPEKDPLLYLNQSGDTYSNVVSENALNSAGIVLPDDVSSGVTPSGLKWERLADATGASLSIPAAKYAAIAEALGGPNVKFAMTVVGYIPLALSGFSNYVKLSNGEITREQALANLLTDTRSVSG
jgi:hypothetical protein